MKLSITKLTDDCHIPVYLPQQREYIEQFAETTTWETVYVATFDDNRFHGLSIIEWIFYHTDQEQDIMWAYWTIGLIFFRTESLAIDFKLVFCDV